MARRQAGVHPFMEGEPMFKKILVPVELDYPDTAALVYQRAANYATLSGAEIHLVTVMPGFSMPIVASVIPDRVVQEAKSHVTEVMDKFVADHCDETVTYTIRTGKNWEEIIKVRREVTKALEIARADKVIGHPLEAEVAIAAGPDHAGFISEYWETLKEISIVSEMILVDTMERDSGYTSEEISGLRISVAPASSEKCERCWTRSTSVGQHDDHPKICSRCHAVVQTLALEVEAPQ